MEYLVIIPSVAIGYCAYRISEFIGDKNDIEWPLVSVGIGIFSYSASGLLLWKLLFGDAHSNDSIVNSDSL